MENSNKILLKKQRQDNRQTEAFERKAQVIQQRYQQVNDIHQDMLARQNQINQLISEGTCLEINNYLQIEGKKNSTNDC